MSSKTLFLDENLYQYLLAFSLKEPEILKELRVATGSMEESNMQISAEQGQLMRMIVQLIGARKIIEIGTFTGYSTLSMAMGLPADGEIIACDVSEKWTDMAKSYWEKAGVADKINLQIAPAMDTLNALIEDGKAGHFDLAFIDADKENYPQYFEACYTLLRPNGLIMIDNTLWEGKVVDPDAEDTDTEAIREVNARIYKDERVEISMLPLGDGLTLARKKEPL